MLKEILILISYSSLICYTCGSKQCGITVCLTWTVTITRLKLICKVNNLNFNVQIEDPEGKLQADCLPPTPESRCSSHVKNGSISQNVLTNETTFILKGNIYSHVNGYWTCRHGTNVDLAKVDVTVLTIKDRIKVPQLKNNTKTSQGTGSSSLSDLLRIKCCGERYPFCKRLIFAIMTASYFAFAALVGWLYKDKCARISQWNVSVVAVPFALTFTILFLNKDNSDTQHLNVCENSTRLNDENHTDNQETQHLADI